MKVTKILIFYGSQTGNAEWISKHIFSESLERGFNAQVMTLNESIELDWNQDFVLIIVTSSTGDGDLPDNANKFFRWIKRNTYKKNYAILGLGDTNYTNFCNTAKRLDKRFQEMGNFITKVK